MIRISYILPCYNTGNYLRECIDSLYRQNMHEDEFEVICVNNASEDDTNCIIFDYLKYQKYKNLHYVRLRKNICSGGAYNEGLKIARGRYIHFVDSDDYLKDNIILQLLTISEQEDLEVLQYNIIPFIGNGTITNESKLRFNGNLSVSIGICNGNAYLLEATKYMNYNLLPVPAYRKIIKRSFLITNDITFTHTTLGTDYLHNLQIIAKMKKFRHIPIDGYYYRTNLLGVTKTSISRDKVLFALNNYCESYKVVLKNSSFCSSVKKMIKSELNNTIYYYFRCIWRLSNEDKEYLITHMSNKILLVLIIPHLRNKFVILCPSLYLFLKRKYKK